MKIIVLLAIAALSCVLGSLVPEEAAKVEVIEAQQGTNEGIYIKINGNHKDSKEQVYMQVNLMVNIEGGNVVVNGNTLPFSELTSFNLQAEICEIKDGITGDFEDAQVTVNFFLHEQTEAEGDNIARAFRLETQVKETDKYDVHMYNVTEVVMELDSNQQEVRRTVTLISESDSKLHKAKHCPIYDCAEYILGCNDYKKDENGCITCECAAMEAMKIQPAAGPEHPDCLQSCEGVCGNDPSVQLYDPMQDLEGCWICPCLATDDYRTTEPNYGVISCDFGRKIVRKFEELPYALRIITVVLLSCIALILTLTCIITVCCRSGAKKNNKNKNLKAYNFGKLQIYVPDNEKKAPLIDSLDVVSADIA